MTKIMSMMAKIIIKMAKYVFDDKQFAGFQICSIICVFTPEYGSTKLYSYLTKFIQRKTNEKKKKTYFLKFCLKQQI